MSIHFIIEKELNNMNKLNNHQRLIYLSKKKKIQKFKNKNVYSNGAYLLDNYIVAKQLYKNLNGFIFWKNEINSLMKVKNNPHFPNIVAADPERLIIYMTYCGKSLNEIDYLPINWNNQFNTIKQTLLQKGLNPNDILPRNICCLNGKIKLIDFGLANNRYNEILISIQKLLNILIKYSKKNNK
jgi:hypothetical protein